MTATGAIQGTVTDSTGAAMPEIRITAVHTASGATRVAQTDETGQFRLSGLAIGTFTLKLQKQGFTTVAVQPFTVSVGQVVVQRIEMKPAEVTERMEVKEQPEALETSATSSSVELGTERIEETPAQNRNYLNFVLVAPGVAASSGSNTQRAGAGTRSAAADSGFSFGGLRGRNNSLSIDGLDNRDETTGGVRVQIGLEMVQDFRVSGATLPAEFGGAAGGAVNVVTRSGTNLWHGDATFFTQNEAANARDPEASTPARPRFRRYQPGTSINGPIRKDRTFFSTAIEQEWESSEEWSEIPAGAETALNRVLAGLPRSAVRQVARGLFASSTSGTEFSFKANHQLNSTHAVSARYALSRGRVSNEVQSVDNFSDRSVRGSSLTQDYSFVAGMISVPGPHVVNDLRLEAARRTVELVPNARGAMLSIPGVVTFGQAYNLDASRTEQHYQLVDGISLTLGRHQLGTGGSIHLVRLDSRLANRYGGIFIFPTLDQFLLGAPDVFIQAFGDPRTNMTTTPGALWLQDRWEPLPGLTVEAGLRYDAQRLPPPFRSATHNVAPRIGVAWQPGGKGKLVFRAGAGLFYDRYPLAYLNDAIQKDGVHGFEQYATGEMATRAFLTSQGGALSTPLRGISPSIYRPDPVFPTTYSRKVTAGVERSLGTNTTFTINYAWVRGFHLPRIRNIARVLPAVYQLEQTSRSAYQGVSVSLNRRLSRELTYLVSYGTGRTRDDASDYDEHPLDPGNLRLDWAPSRQHQAHRAAASALLELPAEELQNAPGWIRNSLSHITLAPILTVGSGRPINALDTTDRFRTGAFPISARPFDLARNPFFGPGTVSLDLRIMKGFWVKPERAVLLLAVESFNLANHTNALRMSPYYAAGAQRLSSYRGLVETLNARQVQFSLSLEY